MIIAESYIGSNDFWNTLVSAIIGIAAGVAAVLATLKAQNPKRGITWEVHSNQSLLPNMADGTPPTVTIRHSGDPTPLQEPRLVELKFRNTGRRDIIQSDFTLDGNSLTFNLGVPISTFLGATIDPPSAPIPPLSWTGQELRIQPSPILRGQKITVSLLVDGPEEEVKLESGALLNTPVKELKPEVTGRRKALVVAAVAGCVMAGLSSAAVYGTSELSNKKVQNAELTAENNKLGDKVEKLAACVLTPEQHQATQAACFQEAEKEVKRR